MSVLSRWRSRWQEEIEKHKDASEISNNVLDSPTLLRTLCQLRRPWGVVKTSQDKLAYIQRWKQRNPEKVHQHRKTWQTRHPDYVRDWRRRNPEKVQAYRRTA